MATVGELIFSRDMDDSSDIWDDTALIKAYDKAINVMKAHINQGHDTNSKDNIENVGNTNNKKKHKKNRRKHKKKERPTEQRSSPISSQFKVGSHCRAVFTEDGQIYEAVIVSMDHANEMCRVRYLGYGNEEDQALIDLLPSKEYGDDRTSDVLSECDSVPSSSHHGRSSRTSQFRARSQAGGAREWRSSGHDWMMPPPPPPPNPPSLPSMCSMAPGFGMPPMMPPLFPPIPGPGMPPLPSQPTARDIPPPPTIDIDELSSDNSEALHNVLISWYMSGYHTGYYQGLKQGKKLAKEGKSSAEVTGETETAR